MTNKSNIREEMSYMVDNPEMMFADGYDDALIGYTDSGVAVYSIEKVLTIMMVHEEMTEEDALEYFSYNIQGSYVGKGTPIYVNGGGHERVLELMSNL